MANIDEAGEVAEPPPETETSTTPSTDAAKPNDVSAAPPMTPPKDDDQGETSVTIGSTENLTDTPKIRNHPIKDIDITTLDISTQQVVSETPPKTTRDLPVRHPTSDSVRTATLPTIEECLFGIPRDITHKIEDEEAEEKLQFFVPLNLLRRVASQGIEDDDEQLGGSHRGLAWRLLLGMLPADRRQWSAAAAQQRRSYHSFVEELFCVEERDIDGKELRGHHAKRHNKKHDKAASKKERKERRAERKRCKDNNSLSGSSSHHNDDPTPRVSRLPVKFVDDNEDTKKDPETAMNGDSDVKNGVLDDSSNSKDNSDTPEDASQIQELTTTDPTTTTTTDDSETPSWKTTSDDATKGKLSSSDVLKDDDISQWNMSDREKKILERLTNHEAVNQLLVKRDCQEWNNFLENATLLDEIRKDVNRTHPHLYFYLEPQHELGARRYGALERILFVWAKLNRGVRYVQGMNEIVGTLYYVLANDFNDEWADHAEADTYILFNRIMSETRDIYVSDLDNADTGIVGRMLNMQNLLKLHDPQVKNHLDHMGIDGSFYAVRWLTTLLSREFLLPDTIRLWDSMFASTHKENFLRYVCVSMVLKIRDQLLLGDFATCLQLLQKFPTTSMDALLDSSRALWIYESQITMACVKGGLTLHQALKAIPPPEKVIMAFGLHGGQALSNREQLAEVTAEVSANAKEAVKNKVERARHGMQVLSSRSQGILGGARKFLQNRNKRNNEVDGTETTEPSEGVPAMPRRGVFRNFSFGNTGRTASDGYQTATGMDDGVIPDIPASNSDAETI